VRRGDVFIFRDLGIVLLVVYILHVSLIIPVPRCQSSPFLGYNYAQLHRLSILVFVNGLYYGDWTFFFHGSIGANDRSCGKL
jgi:hypothetical protein